MPSDGREFQEVPYTPISPNGGSYLDGRLDRPGNRMNRTTHPAKNLHAVALRQERNVILILPIEVGEGAGEHSSGMQKEHSHMLPTLLSENQGDFFVFPR